MRYGLMDLDIFEVRLSVETVLGLMVLALCRSVPVPLPGRLTQSSARMLEQWCLKPALASSFPKKNPEYSLGQAVTTAGTLVRTIMWDAASCSTSDLLDSASA
jgi:hypothetical protein